MAAALYPHDVYHRLVGSDDPCTPLELPPGVPEVLVRADDDVVVLSAFLFEVAPGLHMMAGATPVGMIFSCPGRLALEGRPDGQRCTVLRTGCGDVFRVVKRVAHLNAFLDWAGPLTLTHAACIKRGCEKARLPVPCMPEPDKVPRRTRTARIITSTTRMAI